MDRKRIQNRFGVIVADPPWSYNNTGVEGAAVGQYPTLNDNEIGRLPVAELAADDSVLLLWSTWPKLDIGINVLNAWGFDYVTGLPWVKIEDVAPTLFGEIAVKPFYGVGFWVRGCTEPLLIGRRGKPDISRLSAAGLFGLLSPNLFHSRKPDDVYEIAEYLNGPYVELFARRPRPGWASWGNEIESTVEGW